ncbi:alpha/beta hydrolase [Streptomyces sp. ICBB 8177]|uniref:alpha/beta fold hydrolase n=1 Tax=Streptomyces sp. ICBB 8177 TaxID=563922 RepID=UPI000D68466D|nr:alpha/beta hydrolase [Streptomyces sp. ICBB 8177]PWI46139.1 alpha/beta hydrolase [Streptomyces sp. ICBB 8177]
MVRRVEVTGAGGVRLAAWDFTDEERAEPSGGAAVVEGVGAGARGEARPTVLFLHGLMGRAAHWAASARALAPRYRTAALDQRGHGRSEKPDTAAYDREAYVRDVEAAIEQLDLAPVVLVGHSMGALTAWQVAARRPDLVRALVVCDMRASAVGESSQRDWEQWFKSWPLPFATLADVRGWFAEQDPTLEEPRPERGAFFAEVMEERDGGWWPQFSFDHMLSSRDAWVNDAHWDELAQVRCPALVVRGVDGELGRAEAQEMVRVLPRGAYAEIPDAGHLVPWDRPAEWQQVLTAFLDDHSPHKPIGR